MLSLLLFLLLGGGGVLCEELWINSADEFVEFSNNVTKGETYKRTTVLLDSDIDLNGKTFEPIGKDGTYYFRGTFDGQGHTISNLVINSTSQHVGLFGYSYGTTIKNVVMDSSYSVTSSYASSGIPCVGGVIGYCESVNSPCIIENTVNMASVSFRGDASGSFYFGGIAGSLSSSTYEIRMENCVNYGSVSHAGSSGGVNIGGIAGRSHGSTTKMNYLHNCLNYGTLTNSNTKSNVQYLGGIVGFTGYTAIENCASAGKIISNYSTSNIGGIAGYVSSSQIIHCYWDKDVIESAYGDEYSSSISDSTSFDSSTFELNESVSVGAYTGKSLLDALNAWTDHYYLRDYSHWALNRNINTVSFTINGRANPVTLDSQIILLPSLASEGKLWFNGWYTDASCSSPLGSFEISSDKEVYGKWEENANSYAITFDTRGGTPIEPITVQFGSIVSLPRNTERDNCSVTWWENDYGDVVPMSFTVPAHNLTLYAVWGCTVIRSAADLVDLSKVINSGTSYSGTTVFLGSDISFTDELSQQIEPIGKDGNNYFLGTFDGQGHIISNLIMNSTSQYVGLFGYSEGTIIKNVVMDSSCSVTSSYASTSGSSMIGGIIGGCLLYNNPCLIENTVNMANVSFNGNININNLYLGGIAGSLFSFNVIVYVKNCANYGSVSNIGASGTAYIGGIVGHSSGSSSNIVPIQNCLNYGTITNNNTKSANIGGIAGYSSYTVIENCVSAGKITSSQTTSSIGGIAGYVYSGTTITHCLWTSDVGYDEANGTGSPNITDSSLITSLNTTIMGELNEYAKKTDSTWSRWVMLHLNGGNINSLTQEAPIGGLLKSLPLPVKEGESFLFWCTDEGCSEQYNPEITDASSVTDLYAFWTDSYFLTFDFGNGTNISVVLSHNDTITYPEVDKLEGYTLGWTPNPARMPAGNTTIKAQWTPNNYTLTFDGNGGTPSKASMIVTYNSTYGDLPTAARTGHSFLGWFTEETGGEEVTSGMTFLVADNQTLYAHWTINNYTVTFDFGNETNTTSSFPFNGTITYPEDMVREGFIFNGWTPKPEWMPAENITIKAQWNETTDYVEIVFSTKDLSREQVEEIIEKYVPSGAEFTIEKFERDGSGEIKVIVKFTDQREATSFIEEISTSSNTKSVIKAVGFVGYNGSFSPQLILLRLIYFAL